MAYCQGDFYTPIWNLFSYKFSYLVGEWIKYFVCRSVSPKYITCMNEEIKCFFILSCKQNWIQNKSKKSEFIKWKQNICVQY